MVRIGKLNREISWQEQFSGSFKSLGQIHFWEELSTFPFLTMGNVHLLPKGKNSFVNY